MYLCAALPSASCRHAWHKARILPLVHQIVPSEPSGKNTACTGHFIQQTRRGAEKRALTYYAYPPLCFLLTACTPSAQLHIRLSTLTSIPSCSNLQKAGSLYAPAFCAHRQQHLVRDSAQGYSADGEWDSWPLQTRSTRQAEMMAAALKVHVR